MRLGKYIKDKEGSVKWKLKILAFSLLKEVTINEDKIKKFKHIFVGYHVKFYYLLWRGGKIMKKTLR